jgi:hypothetical protein
MDREMISKLEARKLKIIKNVRLSRAQRKELVRVLDKQIKVLEEKSKADLEKIKKLGEK